MKLEASKQPLQQEKVNMLLETFHLLKSCTILDTIELLSVHTDTDR